ncbi:hypothetical protein HispidOSU_011172 [Sigmodon hispidus]
MPLGKPLQSGLRTKVDELFLRWLSDPDMQRALYDGSEGSLTMRGVTQMRRTPPL